MVQVVFDVVGRQQPAHFIVVADPQAIDPGVPGDEWVLELGRLAGANIGIGEPLQ